MMTLLFELPLLKIEPKNYKNNHVETILLITNNPSGSAREKTFKSLIPTFLSLQAERRTFHVRLFMSLLQNEIIKALKIKMEIYLFAISTLGWLSFSSDFSFLDATLLRTLKRHTLIFQRTRALRLHPPLSFLSDPSNLCAQPVDGGQWPSLPFWPIISLLPIHKWHIWWRHIHRESIKVFSIIFANTRRGKFCSQCYFNRSRSRFTFWRKYFTPVSFGVRFTIAFVQWAWRVVVIINYKVKTIQYNGTKQFYCNDSAVGSCFSKDIGE